MQRTITKIEYQQRNKARVNVYADGEFLLAMPAVTVLEERWKQGSVIDDDAVVSIAVAANFEECWVRGVDYATRSMRSEQDVRIYLTNKDYDAETVDGVCAKLRNYGYLDDNAYIKAYIHDHAAKWGAKKMEFELERKGLDKALIQTVLSELDQSEFCFAAAQKFMRNREYTAAGKTALLRHLYAKGFMNDSARAAVARLWEGEHDD